MKASLDWLSAVRSQPGTGTGRQGQAHLQRYSATFKEWGDGPPLILVPGLAGGLDLMGTLAEELSRDFRVICYQLRGEEDPFALRQRFDLQNLVADLRELIEWFGLERPNVMGISFGGMIALELAAADPLRVDHLMLQGVGANFERGYLQRVASLVLARYPLPHDNAFVNQFFNLLFGSKHRSNEHFDLVTSLCWQTDQSVMAHRYQMVERFDVAKRLPRIQAPTMVLSGRRDLLVSPKSLETLCRELPKCEMVKLYDAGHLASVTHAARIAEEARRFVNCSAESLAHS